MEHIKTGRMGGAALCFVAILSYSKVSAAYPVGWLLDNGLLDSWMFPPATSLDNLARRGYARPTPLERRGYQFSANLDVTPLYAGHHSLVVEEFCPSATGAWGTDPWCGQVAMSWQKPRHRGAIKRQAHEPQKPTVLAPEADVMVLMGLGLAGIAFTRMTRKQRRRNGGAVS